MDAPLWMTVAVVIVIALVVYRYGRKIDLSFKGWGVQARPQAKGEAEAARAPAGSRNVSISGNAANNQIVTGDGQTGRSLRRPQGGAYQGPEFRNALVKSCPTSKSSSAPIRPKDL